MYRQWKILLFGRQCRFRELGASCNRGSQKITQQEKLKELVKNKATSDQLEQQEIIHNRQVQQLLVDESEKSSERRLQIEQKLFDQKYDIYSRSASTSQSDVNKLELEQLKITQKEEKSEILFILDL